MTSSLVGSEMCIRDSHIDGRCTKTRFARDYGMDVVRRMLKAWVVRGCSCLLYTSDAADDM
eukprot:9151788-Prorocentrum_lima.AAC.1